MIKVFLVVVACLAPDYVKCDQIAVYRMKNPVVCQLNRPPMVMFYERQNNLNDGWFIFTRCQIVNTENGDRDEKDFRSGRGCGCP